jgi:autotransporter strand-loop-strand O-heptosyltransferase
MNKLKIYLHGSYIGNTGFNNHTRDFSRELSKHVDIKVRNFTVGSTWAEQNDTPHDKEPYINNIDKKILYEQTLWVGKDKREDFKIYPDPQKNFIHDFNIILSETNHHYFYDHYVGPKIGYTVWESTLLPEGFFNKLKEFDEIWTPSKWQKDCMVKQGMSEDFIKVVPEGVDDSVFFPEKVDLLDEYKDGRFKFILFGRWDYRKSTKEIIETFLKTFDKSEPVDLVVSIDNPWGENMDGFKTTEERLKSYGLEDERIKVLHFPSREDYIKFLKTGHVFVSCARAEGWNLPLIEAMACGTPSIYSNCSGQLEFAEGKGIPVSILGESSTNGNSYSRFSMGDIPGNYYEPDFNDLSKKMRLVYENYDKFKENALIESKDIREKFNWSEIGKIGYDTCLSFKQKIETNRKNNNNLTVSFLDGPRVEVSGDDYRKYFVEFLDESEKVIHSGMLTPGMWIACGRKYYTKWKIRVNNQIVHEFNLENKRVLISFESKSIGDTIAWVPYAIEFAKKNKCKVILSTFHNEWFQGNEYYKDIEFIKPGQATPCYAVYKIGWFKDSNGGWRKFDYYPNQVNLQPLQKTASDILGLEFSEVNYGLNVQLKPKKIKEKYIVIGPNSTAGCKEWPHEYWSELAKKLNAMGYKVYSLTNKKFELPYINNIVETNWNEIFNYMFHAEFFIGLSSGLSWVNWALGKNTVMIGGFSTDDHEFQHNCIRISNDVCIKCWNDPVLKFDPGNWNWCPVYEKTELQHICQKSITVEQVLGKIKPLLN